jgi:ubiquitin carboxyl-terminal hydrolase 48
MPQKRKRRVQDDGLAPGEILKRKALVIPGSNSNNTYLAKPWDWVDSEIRDAKDITLDHRLAACGLSTRNIHPYCRNKYASSDAKEEEEEEEEDKPPSPVVDQPPVKKQTDDNLNEDIIVISDDEDTPTAPVQRKTACTKKACKNNPNCLNYLGQGVWEDEGLSGYSKRIAF